MAMDRFDKAVVGVVVEVEGDEAVVDIGGVKLRVYTLEDVKAGDHVLVHAGFIIKVVRPEGVDDWLRELDV